MAELNEDELLTGISELEDMIAKGDALASAPHDGGFATEGTNIQTKAKAMKKALEALGMECSLEKAETIAKMLSASDMGDDEDGEDDSAAKSTDDEGADALAGAVDDEFSKSLAEEHPESGEMIDASAFLKDLVDHTGNVIGGVRAEVTGLAKSLQDERTTQADFNKKIATALVSISKSIGGLSERINTVSEAPVPNSRAVSLKKSDVAQSPINGTAVAIPGDPAEHQNYMDGSPLLDVPMPVIQEALINKALDKKIPSVLVTEFENQKDFSVLPKAIFKALEKDLC